MTICDRSTIFIQLPPAPHATMPADFVPEVPHDDMSRLDRLPLPLASLFYAAALGAVLLPYLAVAPPGARLIWNLHTLTVALYGALTLLVLHQRPGDRRGELFMFLGVSVSLTLLFGAANVRVGAHWASDALLLAYCGVYLVTPAVAFHMAACIPHPHPVMERHPWLVPACYGVGAAGAAALYLALLNAEYAFLPWRPTLAQVQRVLSGTNWLSLLLSSWGGVALLGSAAQRAATPAQRRQAVIVYAGLLPYACNTALAIAAPGINASRAGQVAQAAVIALVPVSFAVAILGYRLFQVGVLVRRGLVFGLTTGVLAASGYLAAVALDGAARGGVGWSLTPWGAAGLCLVGGMLWQPLARVVAAMVDRRFFPERVALGELQRTIIPELAGFTELGAAAAHLARRLRDSLELETATLLMADADGEWFRPLGWAGDVHGADPRHLALSADQVARMGGGLLNAAPIAEAGVRAAYAVPIRLSLSDRLTGVLLLGRSVHGRALERDALQMLDGVALQASAMLENARLFALATRDPLTGLLRRHAAMDRLAEEVERCRRTFHPFAVALADLDHFKRVNDTRGHAAGDAALRAVADVLASYSRRTDLVARYGGEEFLFLLPDTPAQGARVHAEAVRAQVERALARAGPGGEAPIAVTVSVGVYAVSAPGLLADPDTLVRRADEALYRAKRAGRNRVEAAVPRSVDRDDPAEGESTYPFDTVPATDAV